MVDTQPGLAGTRDQVLLGRVVVVTGGSRGIGAATVAAVARAGADVAIGYRANIDDAERVQKRVAALGRRCLLFRADISRQEEALRAMREVESTFGRIDGLVANAGVLHSAPFLETRDEDWRKVIQTDLFGAVYSLQAVLPGMIERGSGSVVIVSSRLGQMGWPGVAAYSTAKAALLGLTKSLAREFAPSGIRINAVAPAVIETDMTRDLAHDDLAARRPSDFPIGRFGRPEEVADAIVFLLSDSASLFVGQTLNPNGGGFMP